VAFISVGTNIVHLQGQGPQVFKVHGSVYHYQDLLLPKDTPNAQHKYAQLYIHDPQEALRERQNRNPDLSPFILSELQEMLLQCNPFVPLYR
jgi:hypothetical protein